MKLENLLNDVNTLNADEEARYQDEMDDLNRLLEVYAVDTGIPDLAQEHDHYLYGTPKRASLWKPQ